MQSVANIERYYTERNSYASAVMCADTTNKPDICSGSCNGVGGTCTSTEKNYTIAFASGIAPTTTTFVLVATPVGSQAVDGKLSIDQSNAKKQDINNNGTFEASENYWK